MMTKSVEWVLISLNLLPYNHISIRRHGENGVEYLGGGHFSSVVQRFGDMEVVDSNIIDNILCIYVK